MKRNGKFLKAVTTIALAFTLTVTGAGLGTAYAAEAQTTPAETTVAQAETQAAPAETTAAQTETTAAPAETTAAQTGTTASEKKDTWAVYMYFCGSNLESKFSSATKNLLQLMNAKRTDDTIFLAETGGSTAWNNTFVSADKIQRWLYTDGDMKLVDEQPQANMGSSDTLADFLNYAHTNYPADHTMVIFWDHGGGTLYGCCIDYNYDNDSLTLSEIHDAFSKVYGLSASQPPIDILGFDCCLMSTIDVADTFKDVAHYLVASEETEPSLGWNYEKLGEGLAENPHMSALDLSKMICDSYYSRLVENDQADTATLSVTDLSKISELTNAFSKFADEMIIKAYSNTLYYKYYATFASYTENYGGNSRAEGYYDLIDIKDFVQTAKENTDMSTADAVLQAIDDCVLYKVSGDYRKNGGGISFYYDYDGVAQKNSIYNTTGTIEPLKVLYDLGVSGKLDETESNYVKSLGLDANNLPVIKTFENYNFSGVPIQYDENGTAYVDFGSEVQTTAIDAMYNIYYIYNGDIYWIGTDDEVSGDFTTGKITDQMKGKWGYFDNKVCFMELTYDSSDYNLYSVPVLVNGEKMFLQVAYDFTTSTWEVLGARWPDEATALTAKAIYIENGTEVTLLLKKQDEDGNMVDVEAGTFTYNGDASFKYDTLPDGRYGIRFFIEDIYKNLASSQSALFDLAGGVKTYVKDN